MFLAWLAEHATEPDVVPERRVHGLVPLAGHSALTASWQLAEQLQLAARTPGELVAMVAADPRRTVLVLPDAHHSAAPEAIEELIVALAGFAHVRVIVETREVSAVLSGLAPAVIDLQAAQWRDPQRYAAWAASTGPHEPDTSAGLPRPAADLDDPSSVCRADPVDVTARYERSPEGHRGLRAAWLRAGGSLTRPGGPAQRALVWWAALGDDADPRVAEELRVLALGAAWNVRWTRVRGDLNPPWPGPARALGVGVGALSGSVAVVDHQGVARLIAGEDGRAQGRLPHAVPGAVAVACGADGDLAVLDDQGRLRLQQSPTAPRSTGISSLLEPAAKPLEQLAATAHAMCATAMVSLGNRLVCGDGAGRVQVMALNNGTVGLTGESLHQGTVTALAALELAEGSALVYSGGQDGRVRAWAPGRAPLTTALRERNCAVAALCAAHTEAGPVLVIGWTDGLVEHSAVEAEPAERFFRPGPAVRSVAALPNGDVLVGTDESLVCLTPA